MHCHTTNPKHLQLRLLKKTKSILTRKIIAMAINVNISQNMIKL